MINKYIFTYRKRNGLTQRMLCADGFSMSVQADEYKYCSPRDNNGPYCEVEVGYPSSTEPLLLPYMEGDGDPTQAIYAWVPVEVVEDVVAKHGGLATA